MLGGTPSSWNPSYSPYDATSSIAEIATNTTTTPSWTGGKVLANNFFAGRVNSIQFTGTDELVQAPPICWRNLPPTASDVATLLFSNISSSNTNTVYATIQWIEII